MARPPASLLKDTHPEIAAQLIDQTQLDNLGTGSAKKLQWRCPDHPDHIWTAAVYNRTNAKSGGTGCPYCDGKKVLAGFNDVATTHPDVAALFVDQSMTTQVAAQSSKKFEFRCKQGHIWTAPLSRLTNQGSRCPYCSGRKSIVGENDLATTHPDIAAQLVDPSLATQLKAGSNKKVAWQCPNNPHHTWSAQVHHRVHKRTNCPYCAGRTITPSVNDLATTHPGLAAQMVRPEEATTTSKGSNDPFEWQCQNNPDHTWLATPTNRVKGAGCPICVNKQIRPGDNDLATTHPELAARLYDPTDALTVSAGTGIKLRWRCDVDPDHVWLTEPARLLSPNPPGCSQCYRHRRSAPEQDIVEFLYQIDPNMVIITSDTTILDNRRELDIVLPEHALAIEFNGVWWHCENNLRDKHYHRNKTLDAADAGYRLIHVWEDDWSDNRELVLRHIAHHIGMTSPVLCDIIDNLDPKAVSHAPARTLDLTTDISGAQARAFWQANHLQGPVGCNRYFGLVDADGDIRALLGIGAKNHGSRAKTTPGIWDVQRYATCGVVAGGFTRLLHFAERTLANEGTPVTCWTSYSNDDSSQGGMYRAAGFSANHHQPPAYFYVGNLTTWRRAHRSNWMRHRFEQDPDLIYEPGWTERQAAQANGLHRIYDAGKTRWIKQL